MRSYRETQSSVLSVQNGKSGDPAPNRRGLAELGFSSYTEPFQGGWDKVNSAIRKALTEVTLAELCPPRDFMIPIATPAARPKKKSAAQ